VFVTSEQTGEGCQNSDFGFEPRLAPSLFMGIGFVSACRVRLFAFTSSKVHARAFIRNGPDGVASTAVERGRRERAFVRPGSIGRCCSLSPTSLSLPF